MTERVGYIGLGIMGRPMALNLLKAGYPVSVWARRAESMEPLVQAGATACASPADVARQSDIVFTNVSDTADVEAVILGPDGIIHGAESGSVVVDDSTISPLATREMAGQLRKKGIEMLDAPVSGGEQGAIDGTLSMMVGGKSEVFERVRPLFEVLGRNIVLVGDNGAGQVAKMCNQVVIAQTMAAVGEAFTLAEAADVDPAKVREALLGGFAGSKVMEVHGQRMLDDNFAPGFKAKLHRKDMKIALETAAALGVGVPGAAVATQLINALVGAGGGELDSSALVTVQRRMSRND
ncbi:MAG: 2-hydroxy-3-oxopropionate reductase [Chromatiales bacterium]|jgi:2-hydroxy-3-oxopropionate reductase